jgi:hypothetical protein
MDLDKIREAIATLKRAGIEIDSFHCRPETMAELSSAGLTVRSVRTGNLKWLDLPAENGMGRGVGSRHEVTLCGIPIEQRV